MGRSAGQRSKAKSTQQWFTDHRIKLLPRPSQSSDLNLNVWDELRRVHKGQPQDLERFCMEDWSQIRAVCSQTSSHRSRAVRLLNEEVAIIVHT